MLTTILYVYVLNSLCDEIKGEIVQNGNGQFGLDPVVSVEYPNTYSTLKEQYISLFSQNVFPQLNHFFFFFFGLEIPPLIQVHRPKKDVLCRP